ncbi:MAG: ribosome small subunit-dependent GTPase A [Clostridia bacterium]|nr:ribosome small subunit-dependent GTPase A [Clostridia bacterium]
MYHGYGRVIKSNGGLFTVRLLQDDGKAPMPLDGKTVVGRGRGVLRKRGSLLVGDMVTVSYDHTAFVEKEGEIQPFTGGEGLSIDRYEERKNALIRPPMANLDVLFVTVAAASPEPVPETVDKLISIAEYNHIEPVIVITKSDVAPERAESLTRIYRGAGFEVFGTGLDSEAGVIALREYIDQSLRGRIAAFSGASGVGKSTLLNRIFPDLSLQTGELSHRIERGKNTTRCVELYPLGEGDESGFLADTPGFTMLDFERFDFFDKEDLPSTFRELEPYIGQCKYTKCSHTKEEGCAILAAVRRGEIAKSRHKSFCSLYEVLKVKTKW